MAPDARANATHVRPIRDTDLPFAYALSARVFASYANNPDATLRGILGRKRVIALVADRGDTPVGFLAFHLTPLGRPFGPWKNPAVGYLDAIAVSPDAHGRGVGRVLLDHAEHMARDGGAVSMSLMTAETNTRALRLFASGGFHRLYVEANAYRGGQRGVVMMHGLDPGP